MRRADRLMQIVHYLRRMRRAVTAQRIADEFGICQRTVYRDIQDLVLSGVPIFGEAGVGYVIDKKYHLPPVTFDPDELEAIGLGIAMVRHWTDERFAAKANSAFDKIQAILPANRLEELQQLSLYAAPSAAKIPWSVSFSEIRESIRRKQKLYLDYRDLKGAPTQRTVRPLALFFFGPVWLLTAWCEMRQDFRQFRLDRIAALTISTERFTDESDKSLAAFMDTLQCGVGCD